MMAPQFPILQQDLIISNLVQPQSKRYLLLMISHPNSKTKKLGVREEMSTWRNQLVMQVVVSTFSMMGFWGRIFLVHIRVGMFFKGFEEFQWNICWCLWRASVKHKSIGEAWRCFSKNLKNGWEKMAQSEVSKGVQKGEIPVRVLQASFFVLERRRWNQGRHVKNRVSLSKGGTAGIPNTVQMDGSAPHFFCWKLQEGC